MARADEERAIAGLDERQHGLVRQRLELENAGAKTGEAAASGADPERATAIDEEVPVSRLVLRNLTPRRQR